MRAMRRARALPLFRLAVAVASLMLVVSSALAAVDGEAARVSALLRDVQGPDYDKASAALGELSKHPRERRQIVAGLVDTLRRRDWPRCGGDMRDGIARLLLDLKAREAVSPLLDLIRSGKSIEHECLE